MGGWGGLQRGGLGAWRGATAWTGRTIHANPVPRCARSAYPSPPIRAHKRGCTGHVDSVVCVRPQAFVFYGTIPLERPPLLFHSMWTAGLSARLTVVLAASDMQSRLSRGRAPHFETQTHVLTGSHPLFPSCVPQALNNTLCSWF